MHPGRAAADATRIMQQPQPSRAAVAQVSSPAWPRPSVWDGVRAAHSSSAWAVRIVPLLEATFPTVFLHLCVAAGRELSGELWGPAGAAHRSFGATSCAAKCELLLTPSRWQALAARFPTGLCLRSGVTCYMGRAAAWGPPSSDCTAALLPAHYLRRWPRTWPQPLRWRLRVLRLHAAAIRQTITEAKSVQAASHVVAPRDQSRRLELVFVHDCR
jgi:hypothetical protein